MIEGRQAHLLLVEDNPADVFLIKEALRVHGITFRLEWLPDGEEAVNRIDELALRQEVPDLVVLDLNIPKLDGKEVLAHIRLQPALSQTPVVILTSSDSPRDREETESLGATCYIKKPPTLDEFLNVGSILKAILAGAEPVAGH